MAEVIRTGHESGHRYRITHTDRGYLITARSPGAAPWVAAEWLHQTREAADACLDAVMAANAVWAAMSAGLSVTAAMRKSEACNAAHSRVCDQLNDKPLMGQEVRAMRDAAE